MINKIIFYDQRGCGKTEFPKDTSSINMSTLVNDLEALRAHYKIDKMILLGHSFGALVALEYGKIHPEHLKDLILVAPGPSNSDYFNQTFTKMQSKRSESDTKKLVELMMSKKFEDRDIETFVKAIELGDKVNLKNQEKIDSLYQNIHFDKNSANNLLLVNSLMSKYFFSYDITSGLDKITCPAAIIIGDDDNVPFSSAQNIEEKLPNCTISVIKGTSQYPFFENNKEFNVLIHQFLYPDYQE